MVRQLLWLLILVLFASCAKPSQRAGDLSNDSAEPFAGSSSDAFDSSGLSNLSGLSDSLKLNNANGSGSDDQIEVSEKAQSTISDFSDAYKGLDGTVTLTEALRAEMELEKARRSAKTVEELLRKLNWRELAEGFVELYTKRMVYRLKGPKGHYAFAATPATLKDFVDNKKYRIDRIAFQVYRVPRPHAQRKLYQCYLSPPQDTYFLAVTSNCEGFTGNQSTELGFIGSQQKPYTYLPLARLRKETPMLNYVATSSQKDYEEFIRNEWQFQGVLGYPTY